MNPSKGRRRAYVTFGAITVLYLVGTVFSVLELTSPRPTFGLDDLVFYFLTFTYPLVGFLVAKGQPGNAVGWILLGIGFGWAAGGLFDTYAVLALATNSAALPGGYVAVALGAPLWAPPVGLMGTFLLLLFPDGRLLSPRWRFVGWLSVFAIVGTIIAIMFHPGDLADEGFPGVPNPLTIPALAGVIEVLQICIPLIAVCILLSAVSLVKRFRRSRGVERLQLKWLTTAAAILACVFGVAMVGSLFQSWEQPGTPGWLNVVQQLASMAFFLIPISIGIAILRQRLYDIDLVINKTLVYGLLAGFITAIYVGVVVGVAKLIGTGNKPNLALSLAATAIVAFAFQPVRLRVQRLANRLVYGQRISPYEAVSGFAEQVSEQVDVLPRMAEVAAAAVGAERTKATMFLPGGGVQEAHWPPGSEDGEFNLTVACVHRNEKVGELAVAKSRGDQTGEHDRALLQTLASQAAVAMGNLALSEELRRNINDIQKSRKRILEVQDAERRRMERDLHDGAQQQLVGISVKLALAEGMMDKDPGRAKQVLEDLKAEATGTVETLRDLARGIYPPLLADRGIGPAISSHLQKMGLDGRVEDRTESARFLPDVEAAIYFTLREAIQNASKHAAGSSVLVGLAVSGDELDFSVIDQGPGFDPNGSSGSGLQNMRDRIEALGGTFSIASARGAGTTVQGRVPAPALQGDS